MISPRDLPVGIRASRSTDGEEIEDRKYGENEITDWRKQGWVVILQRQIETNLESPPASVDYAPLGDLVNMAESMIHVISKPPDEHSSHTWKGELLIFQGDQVEHWLQCAEKYLCLNSIQDSDWLKSIMLYLDGHALDWYMWAKECIPFTNWLDFKFKVAQRFNSSNLSPPCQYLLSLQYGDSVHPYRVEFEHLTVLVPHLSLELLKHTYRLGLKPMI